MHGKGRFSWSDGRVYDGEYRDDQKARGDPIARAGMASTSVAIMLQVYHTDVACMRRLHS